MKLKQKIQNKLKSSNLESPKSKKLKKQSSKDSKPLKRTVTSDISQSAPITESNSENVDGSTNEFAKTVEESKQKLFEATQEKTKSGRGRKPLPRDKDGNIIREPQVTASRGTEAQGSAQQNSQASQQNFSSVLVTPLTLLSTIPARKYDIPQLALDENEATHLAVALDGVVNAYMPDLEKMSPKSAALLTFGMVSVSLATSKIYIYSEVMNERRQNQRQAQREMQKEEPKEEVLKNPFVKPDLFSQRN